MSKEKTVISAFDELKSALIACDSNRLDEIIAEDYQGFSLNGTIEDKEIIMQTFKPGIVELTKYITDDLQCDVSNELAIISGKGRLEGVYGAETFQHQVLFTDIFKFMNGRWKYYKSQITEISMLNTDQ